MDEDDPGRRGVVMSDDEQRPDGVPITAFGDDVLAHPPTHEQPPHQHRPTGDVVDDARDREQPTERAEGATALQAGHGAGQRSGAEQPDRPGVRTVGLDRFDGGIPAEPREALLDQV
jgi:hypothetical protein